MAARDLSRLKMRPFSVFFFIIPCISLSQSNSYEYLVDKTSGAHAFSDYEFRLLDNSRIKRDITVIPTTPKNLDVSPSSIKTSGNPEINATTNKLTASSNPVANGTYTPPRENVGVNGTGIRKDVSTPGVKVSDPIHADDGNLDSKLNDTELLQKAEETDEQIAQINNVTHLQTDSHVYYNSTFYTEPAYFNEYWKNISNLKGVPNPALNLAYRKATTIHLRFEFPYYGHGLMNLTVATGGFIYTGVHVHTWLAATQYIAPLMANFDTMRSNESCIRVFNGEDMCTIIWEKVNLYEAENATFTFAATLHKNGDIEFAYKDVPIPVQNLTSREHPVKVGISDAYFKDQVLYYLRRKTIYEYHRVDFKNYDIRSGVVLKFTALPTCLSYNTCESCTNHNTTFNCSWCPKLKSCSSGTDRNKQNWELRNCHKFNVTVEAGCVAPLNGNITDSNGTAYVIVSPTTPANPLRSREINSDMSRPAQAIPVRANAQSSSLGGVAGVLVAVAITAAVVAWILYAYTHPHTASGQLLIKYRPSRWNWRRGEARYTAATIHM